MSSHKVQGRVFQGAWNLLFFALVAIVVAACLNWRNSRFGYWINLTAITATRYRLHRIRTDVWLCAVVDWTAGSDVLGVGWCGLVAVNSHSVAAGNGQTIRGTYSS